MDYSRVEVAASDKDVDHEAVVNYCEWRHDEVRCS